MAINLQVVPRKFHLSSVSLAKIFLVTIFLTSSNTLLYFALVMFSKPIDFACGYIFA